MMSRSSSIKYWLNSHSWIGLRETKKTHLHIEKHKYQEAFLENLTQFYQGTKVLDVPACNKMVSFREIHVFLQLGEKGLLGVWEPIFT
jgi:hypothetical protein